MNTLHNYYSNNNNIIWVFQELSKSEEVEGVCSENTQS